MILVDLQKAFDTLDHIVLLQKMQCTDFKELVLIGFFVTLENVFSDGKLINCGVLQGSILKPLLFLIYIYINVLPQALNETGSCLYADDTCSFYQDKNVEKIERFKQIIFIIL